MALATGTRVRFTSELGALAKDGAHGTKFMAGLTYHDGDLGTIDHAMPEDMGADWFAVTPDRQPVEGVEVYVPVHVSMFEVVV